MRATLSLLGIVLLLAACKPRLVYEDRAVAVPIPSDTAQMLLHIDCPDGSIPRVMPLATHEGKRIRLESQHEGKQLALSATIAADTAYRIVRVSGPPIYIDRPYPQRVKDGPLRRLQLLAGRLALLALAFWLGRKAIGIYKGLKRY